MQLDETLKNPAYKNIFPIPVHPRFRILHTSALRELLFTLYLYSGLEKKSFHEQSHLVKRTARSRQTYNHSTTSKRRKDTQAESRTNPQGDKVAVSTKPCEDVEIIDNSPISISDDTITTISE